MTALSDRESRFVARRARLIRYWPWPGGVLLLALAAGVTWLWFEVPLFINPWATIAALEQDTLPVTTMGAMAAMLPLVVLAALVLLVTLLLITFAALGNEKRLLQIVRRLTDEHP